MRKGLLTHFPCGCERSRENIYVDYRGTKRCHFHIRERARERALKRGFFRCRHPKTEDNIIRVGNKVRCKLCRNEHQKAWVMPPCLLQQVWGGVEERA